MKFPRYMITYDIMVLKLFLAFVLSLWGGRKHFEGWIVVNVFTDCDIVTSPLCSFVNRSQGTGHLTRLSCVP